MNCKLIVIILFVITTKIILAGMVTDGDLLNDILINEDPPDYIRRLIDWGKANGIEVVFGENACECIGKATGRHPNSRPVRGGGLFVPHRGEYPFLTGEVGEGPIIYIAPEANEGVGVHEQGHAQRYIDNEYLPREGDPVSIIDEEIRNWEKNKELYRALGPEIYDEQLRYIQMHKRERPYLVIEKNKKLLNEIIAHGGCAYIPIGEKVPKPYKPYLVPHKPPVKTKFPRIKINF